MAHREAAPLLTPIDPTTTGESDVTRAVRDALKRKREAEAAAAAGASSASAAWVAPTAAAKTCVHEVAVPSGFAGDREALLSPRYDGPPAKEYPFVLDPFQKTAVACLERRESVLVAAHTSAGKTVVAEYAIAMAFRDKQKVIYTSPLKALSNQKYRELAEEFEDVGLMTGDTSIAPHATCVVMTTEILRSMAYRGSEMLASVGWVIFDEVHYMQDRERGVVWEECIMFTPPGARCVFLSATLPNALQFAQWVSSLHAAPCHVVYTDSRPTPLQHYLYPVGGGAGGRKGGLYLAVDEQRRFREDNFAKLRESFAEPVEPPGGGRGGRGGRQGGRGGRGRGRGEEESTENKGLAPEVYKIVKLCKEKQWAPLVVFSFSRRDCENYARAVASLDFTTDDEKAAVQAVFNNAMDILSEADRDLRPVTTILPLLRAGIGVHHSGLLPVVKELVELLFQEQILKVLFATETFAMGLNMPARTVVFTQVRKWDGENHRWIAPGEYTQMSGRAGRRGMDERGICIVMCDKDMDADAAKTLLLGSSAPLVSSFKLSYYTLLNVLKRVAGELDMEAVIVKSFHQFQHEQSLPEHEKKLKALEAQAAVIQGAGEEAVAEYEALKGEIDDAAAVMLAEMLRPERILHFLRPGRVVRVRVAGVDYGWGVACSVSRRPLAPPQGGAVPPASAHYTVDTLLRVLPPAQPGSGPRPSPDGVAGELHVVPVLLHCLSGVSALMIQLPEDLRAADARAAVGLALAELRARFPTGLPRLDPVEDMQIRDPQFMAAVQKVATLEPRLLEHPLFAASAEAQRYGGGDAAGGGRTSLLEKKAQLKSAAQELRAKMLDSEVARFRKELHSRSAVLRRLGHLDAAGVVQLKGRAACQIDTADELLVTELMFQGVFMSMEPPAIAALCSCFIPTEKSKEDAPLKPQLSLALATLHETARHVAEVQNDAGIEVDVDEYVDSFKKTLMDPVYRWCTGCDFGELLRNTDLFEGTIIRAVRRLDELLMQLGLAAEAAGDTGLQRKFTQAAESMRHGIMFASSLYL